jgi:hypothetical protein
VSGHSLKEPWSACMIQSIVGEQLPSLAISEEPFEVPTVEARLTFLEKVFLMHKEFQKPGDIRYHSMSAICKI